MHEMAVADALLRLVLETASRHGRTRVEGATLALGSLAGVNPDALSFGFEALARGTAAERCTLRFERVPVAVHCRACGSEGDVALPEDVDPHDPASALVVACAACGSHEADLIRGRELELRSITVEDDACTTST